MPQRIIKYKTIDGIEHDGWDAAYTHEQGLKLVQDVSKAIVDNINGYRDDKQRRIYNPEPTSVNAMADMLVNTELLSIVNKIVKGKVKQ